ncbi:hydroxypyruvate isomerase [Haloferax sp. AS1]|uniref:hydroxypyruvate isomerase family protein n=1 Tax=Haloferax sp. AS1 TaxID=2562277 RepID=UPI0019C5CC4C|nr:TIM barrel protein [Haloferax sp. AS1]MBC9987982.1 hydroxypyruvate isomerase [Haloferax sp. AS1]
MVYDGPYPERIRRAGATGVEAVEFWDWREKDLPALEAAAADAGVDIVSCTAGGVLTDPEAAKEAVETVRESIDAASDIGCPTLILTTGPDQDKYSRRAQRETVVKILSAVAPVAEEADVTLALEPLNTAVDHPGYFLTTTAEGFSIVDDVDSSHVKLLYDVYHQQVTEGNIIATLTDRIDDIGHIHVADVPGRREPGTGEINFDNVLSAINDAGYDGYIGCEFRPSGDPDDAVEAILDRR